MPGHVQISDFNTTDTSMQLTAVYNVNYTINITAQNCAGSNSASTISTLSVGEIMAKINKKNIAIFIMHLLQQLAVVLPLLSPMALLMNMLMDQ